jgi:hypothetical protein
MMQRLAVGPRHDRRHLHHRLVVLPGQQQANPLVAQGHALLRATAAGVEPGTEGINRLGGRRRGLAGRGLAGRGHGSTSSPEMAREGRPLTPRLAARSMPLLTNQRLRAHRRLGAESSWVGSTVPAAEGGRIVRCNNFWQGLRCQGVLELTRGTRLRPQAAAATHGSGASQADARWRSEWPGCAR